MTPVQIKIVPITITASTSTSSSTPSHQFKYCVWKKGVKTEQTKEFFQPDEGKWFNLGSGRTLSKQSKDKIYVISGNPNYPRIAGTEEQLTDFFKQNPTISRDLIAEGKTTQPIGPKVNLNKMEKFMKKHRKMQKVTDIVKITKKPVREGLITNFKEPSKLTVHQIRELDRFNMQGFSGQFRISAIFDGDSFDLVFYLPMNLLEEKRGKNQEKRSGLANKQNGGFFWKLYCRLFGYDAQEHETWEGLCATVILYNILKPLNGVVYGKIGATYKNAAGKNGTAKTYGLYGRVLVDIYIDSKYKTKLVDEIFKNYTGNLSELEAFIDHVPRILNRDKLYFKTELANYRKTRRSVFAANIIKFKANRANHKYINSEFIQFEADFKAGKYILGVDYYGETKNKAMGETPKYPTKIWTLFKKTFEQMSVISDE